MEEERIDLTQWKNENKETLKECVAFSYEYVIHERNVDVLIAELKKCYESEDRLVELLQIIEDKYDIPVKQIAATMSI